MQFKIKSMKKKTPPTDSSNDVAEASSAGDSCRHTGSIQNGTFDGGVAAFGASNKPETLRSLLVSLLPSLFDAGDSPAEPDPLLSDEAIVVLCIGLPTSSSSVLTAVVDSDDGADEADAAADAAGVIFASVAAACFCSHSSDGLRSYSGTRLAAPATAAVVDVSNVALPADESLALSPRADGGEDVVNDDDAVAVDENADSKKSFSMADMSKSADCMTGEFEDGVNYLA